MKEVKLAVGTLMELIFNCLDFFFIDKKYYVFSSRAANDYADNGKFLFERFLLTDEERTFFYTKRKEVLKKIPKNGIYAYSLRGIYILLKSKVLVFSHGDGDFFPYQPNHIFKHKNRRLVNLFHAIAVKKLVDKKKVNVNQITKSWDYFVVSSDFESKFIQNQYDLPRNKMLIMGQSRNDVLIKRRAIKRIRKKNKIILYAPTFRHYAITELFPFQDVDLQALDQYLQKNGMEIMIRLHINEEKYYKEEYKEIYSKLKNIYFAGAKIYPSVNDILHEMDAVLTGYSSIAMDFLLLDRPIGYIPYDYELYKIERGFSFDYFEHLAGRDISTQKDLIAFLHCVKIEKDGFSHKRQKMRNLFHKYQDGNASERLYNFITQL